MKSLRTIILLLVFVASPAIFCLLCGCDKSDKKTNSPLYIQESEQIYVNLLDASKVTLLQRIGVGINDKRRNNYTFSVLLKDPIPSDFQVLSPKEGLAKIKTIYSEFIPQKFSIERIGNNQSLCFDLKDVPAVDLSAEGGCCACNLECGGACSVELTYKAEGNLNQQWAMISSKSEPKVLTVGKRNNVTITVMVKNHSLQSPVLLLRIPRLIKETQIEIATLPEDFVKKDASRWIILEKTITGSQEQMPVSLVIIPQEKGELIIPDLIEVRGSKKELVYPAVEIAFEGKVERTNSSIVSYRGNATFQVE